MFNKKLLISKDIKFKNSIIIENVKLNHSGTYHCFAQFFKYRSLAKLKIQQFCIAIATLKVFGKCSIYDAIVLVPLLSSNLLYLAAN